MFLRFQQTLLLLCALMTFTLSREAQAQNFPPIVQYLAQFSELREFAIHKLIATRCSTYLDWPESATCRTSTKLMLKELDFDLKFTSSNQYVFCAFHEKLKSMLANPQTQDYLKGLRVSINKYLIDQREPFSLWDYTVTYFKSEALATEYIAVLFQDISHQKLHLKYLDLIHYQGKKNFQTSKELLSAAIDDIVFLVDHGHHKHINLLYPEGIPTNLNPALYHFYLPLYLSKKLKSQGVSNKASYLAPLFLTLTYEFITSSPDFRYLFIDPERLDREKDLWKIRDIYASHLGSSLGTLKRYVGFEEILNLFDHRTDLAVTKLVTP